MPPYIASTPALLGHCRAAAVTNAAATARAWARFPDSIRGPPLVTNLCSGPTSLKSATLQAADRELRLHGLGQGLDGGQGLGSGQGDESVAQAWRGQQPPFESGNGGRSLWKGRVDGTVAQHGAAWEGVGEQPQAEGDLVAQVMGVAGSLLSSVHEGMRAQPHRLSGESSCACFIHRSAVCFVSHNCADGKTRNIGRELKCHAGERT